MRARAARGASPPQSGAFRKFWAHGSLEEVKTPRRTGPKCSMHHGENQSCRAKEVVEHIERK